MMLLADVEQQNSLLNLFMPALPWLLVIGFLWLFVIFVWFFVVRSLRGKARDNTNRAYTHWTAVEAKLDRLIELLERQKPGGGE